MESNDLFANLPEEIKIEIVSKLKYYELITFFNKNENYSYIFYDNELWKLLITRDFPFYHCDMLNVKEKYELLQQFFYEKASDIVCKFIIFNGCYDQTEEFCKNISYLLVQYITLTNSINEKDDETKNGIMKDIEYDIFHKIFKVLSIKIEDDKNLVETTPCAYFTKDADYVELYRGLKHSMSFLIPNYKSVFGC